jgi:ATP-dependent helicase HepA
MATDIKDYFIYVPDDRHIGKVVRLNQKNVEVSFFHSIAHRDKDVFKIDDCDRAYLQPQMRVFAKLPDGRWRPGRVKNYISQEDKSVDYEIQFPNHEYHDINERDLEVRCLRPIADPAEVLALGGAETQFFHDNRRLAHETLINLRAACQGLSGYVSSAIEFLPHQLAAVRRVLHDPLPRYLLADEVGLGKTIEVGVILRQWTIDNPSLRALIIAPSSLIPQWKQELASRFNLHEDEETVYFSTLEEISSIHDLDPDVLVIDEAHRVMLDSDHSDSALLSKLAHSTPRLLLLSATPVLADPNIFLKLLNLLDPDNYRLDEVDDFQNRMEERQSYGRLLLGLRPDASSFILKQRANGIQTHFPNDPIAKELSQSLLDLLELKNENESKNTPTNEKEIQNICSSLRNHIADTYRIHHRIIRSRRSDCPEWVFLPRGPKSDENGSVDCGHVSVDPDEDSRMNDLVMSLEDWRLAACASLESTTDENTEKPLVNRYRRLLETLGEGVEELNEYIQSIEPSFDGEKELLLDINEITNLPTPDRCHPQITADAIALTIRSLSLQGFDKPKIVAFTTNLSSLRRITQATEERLGSIHVMNHESRSKSDESIATSFIDDSNAQVLILDRSGEEGLNLQFAHAIIHCDVPFSVERLEQRIGRLDRFGRKEETLRQRIIIPFDEDNSPWKAWIDILSYGFQIFNRSVSDIQFLLRSFEDIIERALFLKGSAGISKIIDVLRNSINEEREKLDEQYILDQISLANEFGEDLAEMMEDEEADESFLSKTIEGWLVKTLNFARYQTKNDESDVFRIGWHRNTLQCKDPWEDLLDLNLDHPLTWKRQVAIRQPETQLLRPGAPLIDVLDRLLRWDDRGTAFATWRVTDKVRSGEFRIIYRLSFLVEPHIPEMDAVLSLPRIHALRRRAESFLQPWTITFHLDSSLEEIKDSSILEIVNQPYNGNNPQIRRDFNLGNRPEALTEAIDLVQFQNLCTEAQEQGFKLIKEQPEFIGKISNSSQLAYEAAEKRKRRMELHSENNNHDESIIEIEFDERVLTSVSEPNIRLDSIGFFILANSAPQVE